MFMLVFSMSVTMCMTGVIMTMFMSVIVLSCRWLFVFHSFFCFLLFLLSYWFCNFLLSCNSTFFYFYFNVSSLSSSRMSSATHRNRSAVGYELSNFQRTSV